jgi:hypothetical protein
MTMPYERTRAVLETREFLLALTRPSRTPDVPEPIRQRAVVLLRHYPNAGDMELAHSAIPNWFGPPK